MTNLHQTLYQRRGAVTFVAGKLGISAAAVSMWRGRGIPEGRIQAVEAALAEMDEEQSVAASATHRDGGACAPNASPAIAFNSEAV
mgnify:CR=1 FL=1